MSRSRTVERRKEKEIQRRRQQQQTLLIAIVAVVVLVAIFIVIANRPEEAPIPAETASRYEGIPRGKTEEGFHYLGSADAPIEVRDYSSFACTACKAFHDEVSDVILQQVRNGDVRFLYMPMYSTGGILNGQGAARAAVCAGEQDKFWEFHDALFNWQGLYGNQAFSENRLKSGINNLGIDRGQWDQCMGSDLPNRVTQAAEQAARNLSGFTGTPTITVNGAIIRPDAASFTTAMENERTRLGLPPAGAPSTETTPEATAESTPATSETTPEVTAEATAAQ